MIWCFITMFTGFSFLVCNYRFGIMKTQICMVGDRLDTDILFGQNGGCKTLLVLSGSWRWPIFPYFSRPWYKILESVFRFIGVTSLSTLQSPSNSIQPDFYTSKISDLLALKAATVWALLEFCMVLSLGSSVNWFQQEMYIQIDIHSVPLTTMKINVPNLWDKLIVHW